MEVCTIPAVAQSTDTRQLVARTPLELGLVGTHFSWQEVTDAAQKLGLRHSQGVDRDGDSSGRRMNDQQNLWCPSGLSVLIDEYGKTVPYSRSAELGFTANELIIFIKDA